MNIGAILSTWVVEPMTTPVPEPQPAPEPTGRRPAREREPVAA